MSTLIAEGPKSYINITQQVPIGAVGIWGTFMGRGAP